MRLPVLARLHVVHLVFALLAVGAATLAARGAVRQAHAERAARDLRGRLSLIAARLPTGEGLKAPDTGARLAALSRAQDVELALILPGGHAIGGGAASSLRPVVDDVLGVPGAVSAEVLGPGPRSPGRRLRVVIDLPDDGGRLMGVRGLGELDSALDTVGLAALAAAAVVLLGGLAALAIGREAVARPLSRLGAWARAGAPDGGPELGRGSEGALADAARDVRDAVQTLRHDLYELTTEHGQLQAVLASMLEGVIVVDHRDQVIYLNPAAERLFHASLENPGHQSLNEIVRSVELQELVRRAQASPESVEDEFTVRQEQDRFLQAHCTRVHAPEGRLLGTLVVLNDVTRLRRLETVRRDFVANVSHEIRTPITTIKGFAETLLEDVPLDREQAERFLGIVKRNADRLDAIVEDLLTLARVEQEDERATIRLEPTRLATVLRAALDACRFKADQKEIVLHLDCDEELSAMASAPLLEQAVINLVDNAVKYGPASSAVRVAAAREPAGVAISVTDEGPGIPEAHRPRVFERFYRIDRARSRKMGGTGLGLAIVKHVAQVHRGSVDLEGARGGGTTFRIHLPACHESR